MTAVNQNAFSNAFQKDANFASMIAIWSLSPILVNMINTMPAGSIVINPTAGAGTYSILDANGKPITYVDPNVLTGGPHALSPEQLGEVFGHELGLDTQPGGMAPALPYWSNMNPTAQAQAGNYCGVTAFVKTGPLISFSFFSNVVIGVFGW